MAIRYIEAFVLVSLALASDIKTYKIKNGIVLLFILAGLATNVFLGGLGGLAASLWGLIVPILLLFVLYAAKMLGAGDIKLFGAIGAVTGLKFTLYTMAYSFLSGGVIAVVLLLVRKNGRQRLLHLGRYLKSCFLAFSLLPYTDFQDKSDGAKFRFAWAIASGTLINISISLFQVSQN